ncbi:hypothetical protein AGDE_14973 [Angomonas deanei]|uniref:Uncharacterized protein n=1 Tax=Angomonas deanei TaxID=59799 RepID=A0A7G2CEU3_9TRYP|nr:hypothetical protein AGDE_14973 [Angomonas deanei]CAD2217501.1 hypothetical protein, conserved [Angomonas deanei]|eukprot:EPY19899.1 hypothetical protein AGDE_14973 [Angomonas deanei]
MTGTPADDPPSVSPLEDEMYTEFLDLAAANSDLSVLQAPEGEGLREGGPAPSVRYVVGGAIFNRQKNKGKTINSAFLSNVRLRRGLGRGAGSVGVLDFGALFCPFTKQFFSLRSPHWSHLRSAGFDINAMLLFGRTVDLVYPRLLYRTACRIQRNVSQALTDGTGKSRYPPMWSPTLQNTLGALLENAPTTTLDQFHEFMTERLEMTRGEEKQRLIPIALDSARCLPGAPPMHEMHDLDKMMSSRTRLLQQVPKIPYAPCTPYNIAPDSSSAVEIGSQRVLDALHHNPAIQLPGLPRHVRSAFVRLPFRKAYTHGSPIFNVCTSFLKEMITTKGDANVYFCPIEHTVDYNSVSDLLAFPVLDTTHFDGTAPTDGTPVPLLAIGFDIVAGEGEDVYFADHTKNIIVFSNAHLLSRRAVGRILDQWTRNGAAAHCVNQSTVSEPVRRTNGGESTNHEKRKHWQLMLNQFPFTFPTRAFYTQPFGSVQAVFVGFDFSHQITEKRAGVGESELIVSQTPAENVFNLSEPLSFTLMRIKDRYHCLSAEAKTAFLEEVIRGARSTFPDLKVEERVTLTLPSGRVSSKLLSCSLSAAKGGSIFYRSCEELLEEGEDFSKTERVLTKFPFLSLLQCQHPLVDAYMLSIPDSDIPSRSPPRMNEDGKVGLYTYHRFADFLNAFEENVKLNERSSRASSKACYDPLKNIQCFHHISLQVHFLCGADGAEGLLVELFTVLCTGAR